MHSGGIGIMYITYRVLPTELLRQLSWLSYDTNAQYTQTTQSHIRTARATQPDKHD